MTFMQSPRQISGPQSHVSTSLCVCVHHLFNTEQDYSFNELLYLCGNSDTRLTVFPSDVWTFLKLHRWFQCPRRLSMPQFDISFYSDKESCCALLPLSVENEIIKVKKTFRIHYSYTCTALFLLFLTKLCVDIILSRAPLRMKLNFCKKSANRGICVLEHTLVQSKHLFNGAVVLWIPATIQGLHAFMFIQKVFKSLYSCVVAAAGILY